MDILTYLLHIVYIYKFNNQTVMDRDPLGLWNTGYPKTGQKKMFLNA